MATQQRSPEKTVVSITFDDGQASQYSTLPMLRSHGMSATFYVNSGLVGSSNNYMGWQQILQLANAGNEIGGHTVHHVILNQVSAATARQEICGDRKNLIKQGLAPVTSFAYPTAAERRSTAIVKSCGYSSARGAGELQCQGCSHGESIPPRDPFRLRTPIGARITTTLPDFERKVTDAERHGGGWVILVFHGICANLCTAEYSTPPSRFVRLLDWLEKRRSEGTVVRTVGDVIANGMHMSTAAPRTTVSCEPSPCADSASRSANLRVRLHATSPTGSATSTYFTTDGTNPKTSPAWHAYTGPFAVPRGTTVRFYARDAAGHSEMVQTRRIPAGVAGSTVDPGQGLGGSSPRMLIAQSSFALFLVMLFGGAALLWRSVARRKPHDDRGT